MNFKDSILVVDPENGGESWTTDAMILTAKSLQHLVKELGQLQGLPQSGSLLFEGKFVAVPVLLTLATEIALKALQCQERQAKPDRCHDLLKLFEGLEKDTQVRLAEKLPEVLHPIPGAPPVEPGVKATLNFHRKVFEEWGYLYESGRGEFQTTELDKVLTAIIETYDETASKPF